MTKFSRLNATLNGMMITSLEISRDTDVYEFQQGRVVEGLTHWSATISGILDYETGFNHIQPGSGLLAIGNGLHCEYCDSYWPKGNYLCFNCGAKLVQASLTEPVSSNMIISSLNVSAMQGELISFTIGCDSMGPMDLYFMEGLYGNGLNWVSTQTLVQVDRNKRLCEWCGHATENSGNCYNCGGARTPLRELVDMEHECLWCGEETNNGIICKTCGTPARGTAIGDIIDREAMA